MRVWRCLVSVAAGASLSGCLFGSVDPQLRQMETQIQSIVQRVDRLEASVGGVSAAGSAAVFAAPAAAGALAAGTEVGTASLGPVFSWRGALNKLARGVTNLVTGWVEVPKRVQETTGTSGAAAGFTWGLLRGAGHGFVRTAAGVYETVTFPFPAPPDYRPVIRPAYVFICEDGDR